MAAGKERKVRRIQERLDELGLKFKDIQRRLGFNSYTPVHDTIHGRKNNRRVLNTLLDWGVPAGGLELPRGVVGGGRCTDKEQGQEDGRRERSKQREGMA